MGFVTSGLREGEVRLWSARRAEAAICLGGAGGSGQQRDRVGGAGGDVVGVAAAGGPRPVSGINVPFRPREKG